MIVQTIPTIILVINGIFGLFQGTQFRVRVVRSCLESQLGFFRTARMVNNEDYKILDPSALKCFSFPCQGKEVDASILANTDVIHVCEVYFGSDGFWVCVNNDSVLNPLDCPYGSKSLLWLNHP